MTPEKTFQKDVQSKAANLADDAKAALRAEVDRKADALRDTTADKAQSFADAADAAASKFDGDSLQARAAHQVADQIESVARHLRGTDLNQVVHSASEFARRNPLIFISGAALVGLTATRFLKARDPQRPVQTAGSNDPWGSNETRDTAERDEESFNVPS